MIVRRTASALALVLLLTAFTAMAAENARPQGWLGISLIDTGQSRTGDPADAPLRGVAIGGIVAGSPAQKAGLRARDRILTIDGTEVSSPAEVVAKMRGTDPGSWVTFGLDRRGKTKELQVAIDARPDDAARVRMVEGWIGVEAIDLPASLRAHFGAPREAGVMISGIADQGPALAAGLDVGDVVFEVDGEPVMSTRHLEAAIYAAGVGNHIEIRLMRNGADMTVEPTVEERPRKE